MAASKNKHLLFHLILGLVLCLLIISAAVTFTLNFRPLYHLDMHLLDIPGLSGFSESEILENYNALIDYNRLFNHEPLHFPTLAMSETGRIHFEEVKRVFDLFGYLTLILLPAGLIGMIIARRFRQRTYLRVAGILGLLIPVGLGAAVAVSWDKVFVLFHELVFRNDFWIFDEVTDPVILILPDTFFLHCAVMIFALVIIGSLICLRLSFAKKSRDQHKSH